MIEREDLIERMFIDSLALDVEAQPKRVAEILEPDKDVLITYVKEPLHSLTIKCGDEVYIVTVVVFRLPK